MHALPDQRGTPHLVRRDVIRRRRLGQYRQNAKVESIVGHEEGARQTNQRCDQREMRPHRFRNGSDDHLRHRLDHLGAIHDPHEDPRRKNQRNDRHGVGTVSHNTRLLVFGLVIDHQRQRCADDEQNGKRQQFDHQRGQQNNGQGDVDPELFRTTQFVGFRIFRDGFMTTIVRELDDTETSAFLFAPEIGQAKDKERTKHHPRNHWHEDVLRLNVQRRQDTAGRTAPGNDVHHAILKQRQRRQDQRIDADATMHGEQCGTSHEIGRRTVSIERNRGGQRRRPDADLQWVAMNGFENFLDDRIEHAGIDHRAKKQNRETDHDPGGRHFAHAVHHHLA